MNAPTGQRAKSLGAYYTDRPIADFLARWAVRSSADAVLDPSFGGGVFLDAALGRLASLGGRLGQVSGVELDPGTYAQVRGRLHDCPADDRAGLIQADFFELDACALPRFDAVIGNPPFIRYQRFESAARARALARARDGGVRLSKLAGTWAAFVVHGAAFLRPGGRLALVLPGELLQAVYARPLLSFLGDNFGQVGAVSFAEPLFPGLDQDTLLLLADEYGGRTRTLRRHRLKGGAALSSEMPPRPQEIELAALASGSERLGHHDIPAPARELYRTLGAAPRVARLGDLAEVGIGYVTGANDFFHLTPEDAGRWNIPERFLRPAVLRGRALSGLSLTREGWGKAAAGGDCGYLLSIDTDDVPPEVARYLHEGERLGVARSYKCRARARWYALHKQHVPDAFLTSLNGSRPQLVANDAGAVAPNTLHIVRLRAGTGLSGRILAGLWQTSLTALSAELEGHAMGGGMLKLEPGEAKRILIAQPPAVSVAQGADGLMARLDALLREGRHEEARCVADRVILQDALGLSEREVTTLREAAHLLRGCRSRPARGRAES